MLGRDLGTGEAFDPSTRVVHFSADTLLRAAKAARLKPIEAGIPRAIPSPQWQRTDGVWLEYEAPVWHGLAERLGRGVLQGLGRVERMLSGDVNHLSPSIYVIAQSTAGR
jgi:hypothetical protein